MKLKTKVVISMVLLVIIPATVSFYISELMYTMSQGRSIEENRIDSSGYEVELMKGKITNYTNRTLKENTEKILEEEYKTAIEGFITDPYYGMMLIKDNDIDYMLGENRFAVRDREFDQFFLTEMTEASYEENVQSSYNISSRTFFKFEDGTIGQLILYANNKKFIIEETTYGKMFMITFLITLILAIIAVFLWLTMSIRKPLNKLMENIDEISEGKFTRPVFIERKNEFRGLTKGVEKMRKALTKIDNNRLNAEQEKKDLIANISHDIRTPLTAIKGYVQGIKDGVVRDSNTMEEYLGIIGKKTDLIDILVNDLKYISKFDVNKVEINKQSFNLDDFLLDCIDEISYDVKNSEVDISYKNYLLYNEIEADPQKLQRVFRNLINNSIKYNKDKSIDIEITTLQAEDYIKIVIADNGVGVQTDAINKIFDRFYREDKSRNSDVEGSGIGLSICSEIIQAHNGTIKARETIGGGLTIEILLRRH